MDTVQLHNDLNLNHLQSISLAFHACFCYFFVSDLVQYTKAVSIQFLSVH